jgi:hypothetical protein
MKAHQPNHPGNILPFQARKTTRIDPVQDGPRDNIVRMLDLSKYEQPHPVVEHEISMRANIVAMVLLGLLVFLAAEDFYKLERSNLCMTRSECIY